MKSFDLQPHLVGDLLELRPLRAEDWDDLFAVASDPMIWEQHPSHDRYKEEVFKGFFLEALESHGALVAVDRKTQKIIGSSRYFEHEPGKSEIEIGWTFLARSHWGGKYNREMKCLMLGHALDLSRASFSWWGQRISGRKKPWKTSAVLSLQVGGTREIFTENLWNTSCTK